MASVPAPLKSADIARFALRATQLEKIKPQISYWLTLFIVETILKNGLEKASEECMVYTATLMDQLEGWKTENPGDQTIHDDVAAQAFVEQFALGTFERADKAMRGRKTTVQTADTFQAARTFLDILSIWQKPLDAEIVAKSKYAKYHAVRILKAIKAGEDPNLPEEQQEPAPASPPPLDPADPEVQRINALQPSVEDAEDQPAGSFAQARDIPTIPSFPPSKTAAGDVSPLESEHTSGYFAGASPQIPTFTADDSAPTLPTASAGEPMDTSDPPSNIVSPVSPSDYYTQQQPQQSDVPPPSVIPPPTTQDPPTPALNHRSARTIAQFQTPSPSAFPPTRVPPPAAAPIPPAPSQSQSFWGDASNGNAAGIPNGSGAGAETYRTDDEAILLAQKHGKWALSALNFDDVETAVKEFRLALQHLGAR